jgi:hypothetical protein
MKLEKNIVYTDNSFLQIVFLGPYRICREFEAGIQCKQWPCTFAHYPEEAHLWTLDREGQFNLEQFVPEMQQYLMSGEFYCF